MGSEASKIQPPEGFGKSTNQFQIVSPVSDLSCPSDIQRINRLRCQHRRPADSDRRLSKTMTNSLSNGNHVGGVPPPANFYFLTTETEKAIDRTERRIEESEEDNRENQQPNFLQTTKQVLKKTKKALKKTHQVMQGCFADDHAVQLEVIQRREESKHCPTLGVACKVPPQKSKSVGHLPANTKPIYKAMDDPSVTPVALKNARPSHVGYHVPSTQKKRSSDARPLLDSESVDDESFRHPAIHEADDYFSRLSTGSSEASPYVQKKPMLKALGPSLCRDEPGSPVSNLFEDDSESVQEGEVKLLTCSDVSTKAPEPQRLVSPSYQNAIGTIAETPGYYEEIGDENIAPRIVSEKKTKSSKTAEELIDEITAKANRALATISEKSDDDYSNDSASQNKRNNVNSAFRPRAPQAKIVTASSSSKGSDRRVSKLESLIRPVLPAWSADDAQSVESYDRYQIKLTESAPGALDAQRRSSTSHGMTALEKKLAASRQSPSMRSYHSHASANSQDYGPQNRKGKAGSEVASINTTASRDRLSNRYAVKAVVGSENADMLALDDYAEDAERRKRFSMLDAVSASVGLAPKESIDVPSIESRMSETMEGQYREREIRSMKAIRQNDSEKTVNSSPEASISVPEIHSKVSDLTEDSASYSRRHSAESANSRSNTTQDAAESPELVSGGPKQVNWSYSIKEGGVSAVTPHFGKDAKDAKNTTKSPYLRFENAKSKFGTNHGAIVKKEASIVKKETAIIKKKDVPYRSPRGNKAKQGIKLRPVQGGGNVANKIEALNQRVVDAKIDRKMHRWTKSNPRKYGVVESNAVRTRAIVQYKTDVIGLEKFNYMSAAKFNTLPIDDDDESSIASSVAASRHSKKSVTFADVQPSSLLQMSSLLQKGAEYEDEEGSKVSTGDLSKLTTDSHSTFRRYRSTLPTETRASESTYSTSASGVTNIKKQIFRGSTSTSESTIKSMASHGDSTTMSAILEKENVNYPQFRAGAKTVKPTEQSNFRKVDPHPAQTWRSLAAAAQTRDSQKKPSKSGARHEPVLKNRNTLTAYRR